MGKYVKKPIPVECRQLLDDYSVIIDMFEWVTGEDTSTSAVGQDATVKQIRKDGGLKIETKEGTMLASFGDWIICGIHGEFYPCKPDIFEESYQEYVECSTLSDMKTKLTDAYEYTFTPEIRNKVSNVLHNIANIFE